MVEAVVVATVVLEVAGLQEPLSAVPKPQYRLLVDEVVAEVLELRGIARAPEARAATRIVAKECMVTNRFETEYEYLFKCCSCLVDC